MDTFTAKIYRFIRDKDLLTAGDRVVAGISGGSDSICLLMVLSELKPLLGLQLVVVHVNHRLRGKESDTDEQFVREFCRELGVACHVFSEDIASLAGQHHWSLEEAGRNYRYQCMEEVMQQEGADKIASAHHLDDQSETVLMNLLRGSGPDGLTGIRPKRGPLIRPLLCVRKAEILDYLSRKKIPFRTDSTNTEMDHTRNRVRMVLLPWIREQINPGADLHLAQTAELLADTADYLHEQAQQAASQILDGAGNKPAAHSGQLVRTKDSVRSVMIDTGGLLALPKVLQREVIRIALCRCGRDLKDIGYTHIEAVLSLAKGRTGARISLPGGLQARKTYGIVILCEIKAQEPEPCASALAEKEESDSRDSALEIEVPPLSDGERICLQISGISTAFSLMAADQVNLTEIPQKMYTKWLDYDKIKNSLCLRRRRSGDYMEISEGRKKRLRRILIDEKIPAISREDLILLADGPHILAAAGLTRISEYYKVTKETRHILEVEWLLSDFCPAGQQGE